ncbi:MAG: hypothetical protein QW291_01685 [Thermofilaceae archaeon]
MPYAYADREVVRRLNAKALFWYPFARLDHRDKPDWSYLVDCFASSLLGSKTLRLLLSRKVSSRILTSEEMAIEAPVVEPLRCSEEVLNEFLQLADGSKEELPQPVFFFDQADYTAVRLVGAKGAARKIEETFRNYAVFSLSRKFAQEIKPGLLEYRGVIHILMVVNAKRQIFTVLGDEVMRSRLHEKYLLGESIVKIELEKACGSSF